MAERFTAHPRFPGLWETEVTRQRGDGRETTRDWISVEEPLSVSVDEDVLATTMRTPEATGSSPWACCLPNP